MDYEIKNLDLKNSNLLSKLYQDCFFKNVEENYFHWKYQECPHGDVLGKEAWDVDNLIGFYGILPEKMIFKGEEKTVYQSMDTMTHSNYGRKGIFSYLAKECFKNYLEISKDRFIYGFTGLNSFHGFIKNLGFFHAGDIHHIYLPKFLFRIISFSNKSKFTFKKIDRFNSEIDFFYKKRKAFFNIEKKLDSSFLNWRTFDHPLNEYSCFYIYERKELIGYFVYRFSETKVISLEYFDFLDRKYLKDIKLILKKIFEEPSCKVIETFQPTSSEVSTFFFKAGFFRSFLTRGPFQRITKFIYNDFSETNFHSKAVLDDFNLQPLIRD